MLTISKMDVWWKFNVFRISIETPPNICSGKG